MQFDHEAFDTLVKQKRKSRCRPGAPCEQREVVENRPPPPETFDPPPNPFDGMYVPNFYRNTNQYHYRQTLHALGQKRAELQAAVDNLTFDIGMGSTQGLGNYLRDAAPLLQGVGDRQIHFEHKELLRQLPVEHLRQLYRHATAERTRNGGPHPSNHPTTEGRLRQAGSTPIVETLAEDYGIDPRRMLAHIIDNPQHYPPIYPSDQRFFDQAHQHLYP